MAITRILFSDLKTGACSAVVETRLLRFWEMRSPSRGGELMRVDMLLLDMNSTMMLASINAPRLSKYRGSLAAGAMFSLAGFDVVPCKPNRMLTESPLLIRFNGTTEFDVITEPLYPFPKEAFRFSNETDLLGLANTNSRFPDIVAEIVTVKSTVRDPPKGRNHVMATIKLDNTPMILSLFDSQAIAFHRRLETMSVGPRVIIATNINPRMVGARMFLNPTSGTHIYFDNETMAGQTCLNRLVIRDAGLAPAAPLLRQIAKVEPVTIAELNSFAIAAVSEDIDFLCTGRVTRLNSEKGWCYIACTNCGRKLQRKRSTFTCVRCNNHHAVGDLRYRVELAVVDDTAEGIFVCFDGVMTKMHELEASAAVQVLAKDGVNLEDSPVPQFITGMEGKTYTFQVKLTTYDFTAAKQSFTVTRILGEHELLPLPDFVNNGNSRPDDGNVGGIQPAFANLDPGSSSAETIKEPVSRVPVNVGSTGSHVHKKARIN